VQPRVRQQPFVSGVIHQCNDVARAAITNANVIVLASDDDPLNLIPQFSTETALEVVSDFVQMLSHLFVREPSFDPDFR
jgi:hypothetical protein